MNRFKHYPSDDIELFKCWKEWNAKGRVVRFGQYMYNKYIHNGEPWPELFYCEDHFKSYVICSDEIEKKD